MPITNFFANLRAPATGSYEQQAADLRRRQQLTELLQQQAAAPLTAPDGGRFVVPISPVSGLAKVLSGYLGGRMARDVSERETTLNQRARQEALDFLQSQSGAPQPLGRQPQPAPLGPMAATPNYIPPMQMPAPTAEDQQKQLMTGLMSGNPYTSRMAEMLMAQQAARTPKPMSEFEKASLNKPVEVSAGSSLFNPVTGEVIAGPSGNMTPYQEQQLGISQSQLGISQSRLAAENAERERRRQEEQQKRQEEERTVAQTVTDRAGNVTLLNKFGRVITPTSAAGSTVPPTSGTPTVTLQGKPSPIFEAQQRQEELMAKNLDTAIAELKDIVKPGGLLDVATGSGIGRGRDATFAFFGEATEGAKAAASLKPIADLALKLVPRFEGPQSDKDTQSYNEAAGQLGNDNLPGETRKDAAKTIIRLMENRRGQFSIEGMINDGTSPSAGVDMNNPLLQQQ